MPIPFRFFILLFAMFVAAPTLGQIPTYDEFANDTQSHQGFTSDTVVRVISVADNTVVQRGADLPIAIVLDIVPGWHIWTPENVEDQIEGIGKFEDAIHTKIERLESDNGAIVFNEGFLQWPEPHTYTANLGSGDTQYASFEGRAIAWLPATVSADAPLGPTTIKVDLVVQSCNDKSCKRESTISSTVTVEIVEADGSPEMFDSGGIFDEFPPKLYSDLRSGVAAPDIVKFDLFGYEFKIDAAGTGLILLLGVAAFGGFLLNLTPCVLPVIPLKIMGLSQSAQGSRLKTVLLGLALGAGVIGFWLMLGFLIASVSSFTASNQLFQYPLFTITVGVFIAIMAIGMCGLFTIELPSALTRFNPGHESVFGSFLFGIMTAILSTPCTAPFMGAAAGWAASKSPAVTMLVFATIGFGMALPYIVLSAYPKLISKMPRSGPASVLIKQVMGLLMMGAALYFVGVGFSGILVDPPNPPSRLYWWAVALPLALAGLWMTWQTFKITPKKGQRAVFGLLGLLIAISSVYGAIKLTDEGPIEWTYYTHERFDDALASGQVVLLEYTAEWCLNCKALEQQVLHNHEIADRIARDDVHAIKIDLTKGYAEANERLVKSGRRTIPLLQIFSPDGQEVFKSDAYTQNQVLNAIDTASQGQPRNEN